MIDQPPPDVPAQVASWRDHVVLCGLGTAGLRVAEGLIRAGTSLVVVDTGEMTALRRALDGYGVRVVEGDCTDPETLRRAGIVRAATLIVMIDDDMVSLRTALVARDLHPDLRLVIRLFNQRLAGHLLDLPVRITALSLSAVAAPVFTLAARCRAMRGAFVADGALCMLARTTAGEGGHTLEYWGRLGLATVACTAPDGETVICPPASLVPPPGSRLLVAGDPDRLLLLDNPAALAHGLADPAWLEGVQPIQVGTTPPPARRTGMPRPRHLATLWRQSNRVLRLALVALPATIAFGVLVFHLALGLTGVDALYFTVSLVTTVGFGDFNLSHASAPVKLFGVTLMLLGTALLAVLYALIAEFVLQAKLEDLVGRRPETVAGHYVVAGLGTVGYRVVAALHQAGQAVVAIESAESGRFVRQVRALGVPLVFGDAAQEETLRQARIGKARALIAVTTNDLANAEAVLNARALQPEIHVVLRVFDPDLAAQARQGLGIPCTFSPALIGAPTFVRAALDEEAPQLVPLPVDRRHGQRTPSLTVTASTAREGDGLCGLSMAEISARHGGVVVARRPAARPERLVFAPELAARAGAGDRLVLAVPAEG